MRIKKKIEATEKEWNIKLNFKVFQVGSEKGINLGSVDDTAVSDPEGVNSPVQVESLLRFPKRQPLSQSSLINLDNINTSFLKILHFVLDGQYNLIASLMSDNRNYM